MQAVAPAISLIRAFEPDSDLLRLHALWQETVHSRWTLPIGALENVLADARVLLVAERQDVRVGFCAADHDRLECRSACRSC